MPHLSATQRQALQAALSQAAESSVHRYPWPGLEDYVTGSGQTHLSVFVYGSLLNHESALLTLSPEAMASSRPAVAYATKRMFEYVIPHDNPRYGSAPDEQAIAALNVRATGDLADLANGIVLDIPLADIDSFRKREIGYDLVAVPCRKWRSDTDEFFQAYILQCPEHDSEGNQLLRADISPHPNYYNVCRDGAAALGEDFLQLWLETSYLSDGKTPAGEWETSQ